MSEKGLHSKGAKLEVQESGSTYTRIPYLLSIPELGGDPEKLDTTTLEDASKTSIAGLQDYGALPFLFLYKNADADSNFRIITRLQATGKAYPFRVTFPDGTGFSFTASVSHKTSAVEVDSVLQFTANLNLASELSITHPTVTVEEGA